MGRREYLWAGVMLVVLAVVYFFQAPSATQLGEQGNAKVAERDLEGALAAHTQAIESNANFLPAYINRAVVNYARGDWQAVIADTSVVIKRRHEVMAEA